VGLPSLTPFNKATTLLSIALALSRSRLTINTPHTSINHNHA